MTSLFWDGIRGRGETLTAGTASYDDSKLWVTTLAARWAGTSSRAVDPGWVPTRMGGAGAPDDLTAGHQTRPAADGKSKGKKIYSLHFQRIAHRGACGKTRVVLQNRRPDSAPTRRRGHDVGVLSTYGRGHDLEPLMRSAVRWRALPIESPTAASGVSR